MKNNQGFTLFELIVVLAVVIISMGVVTQSYAAMVNANQLGVISSLMHTDIHLTRSAAVATNSRVTMKKSGDGWEQGWIIFYDSNNNAEQDDGEELLKQQDALNSALTLRGNRPVKNYVSYLGNGLSRSKSGGMQAGTFMLCNKSGEVTPSTARAIVISTSGRPRVTNDKSYLNGRNCGT